MADFLSNIKSNASSVTDQNQILNRGVDKGRTMFLKGLTTTSSGQKEDPTYLGFRIMFDMGHEGLVDPESFLPISPLFSKGATSNIAGGIKGMKVSNGAADFFHGSRQQIDKYPNYTENFHYMTAESFLRERRSAMENQEIEGRLQKDQFGRAIPLDTGANVGGGIAHRADALIAFKNLIVSINEKSPWFIKTIDGLDSILKVTTPRQIGGGTTYKEQRSGILTFDCLDAIDLRISAMADLYRKATYDFQYHRDMLPHNLRKFRMWIIVTEIRQIDLQKNLADVLNPFNISGVGSTFDNLKNIAQSSGILNDKAAESGNNPGEELGKFVNSFEKLTPYILMYQLDLCEFNFDESYPFTKLDNTKNDIAVANKFKVHVGNVKEYKMQYNILSDLLKNESTFAPLLIQDSWNLNGSKISTTLKIDNNTDLFTRLANNFINNSVASVVQQQVSPIVTKKLLGNAYGFNISDAVRSLNSAQDLVNGVRNTKDPLGDYRPQSKGFGGPGQRQYPTLKEDVYATVPENLTYGLGNQYPSGTPAPPGSANDVYGNNPGVDLGLPQRQYPINSDDLYTRVPGVDSGVPDRIYPTNVSNSDVYPTNPGQDLALPQRTYPANSYDEYVDNPGVDLGVPQRVYASSITPNPDEYLTNPGPSLGLPQRQYPSNNADEYATVPGNDLGVPQRVYRINMAPVSDEYPTNPGVDLGVPQRQYPYNTGDEYADVPGRDLGVPQRVYPSDFTPGADKYPTNPGVDLGVPDRQYPSNTGDEYADVPGRDLGVAARVYPNDFTPGADKYPTNPGVDLGLPQREYPYNTEDEYSDVPGKDLGGNQRIYKEPRDPSDVYPTNPSEAQYPENVVDEYKDVPGKDLGGINRVYEEPKNPSDVYPNNPETPQYSSNDFDEYNVSTVYNEVKNLGNALVPSIRKEEPDNDKDKYKQVPGRDLGAPFREYVTKLPESESDVYTGKRDLGLPDRIYSNTQNDNDQYPDSPGPDLGVPSLKYVVTDKPMVSDASLTEMSIPQRKYRTIRANVYKKEENDSEVKNVTSYPSIRVDEYPTVPGKDLGVPKITYSMDNKDTPIIDASLEGKIKDLSKPQRIYPTVIPGGTDVYPTNPPNERVYPEIIVNKDAYNNVPGSDLSAPDRVYRGVHDDQYSKNPGEDLGLPDRVYQVNNDNMYRSLQSNIAEIYKPSLHDDVYNNERQENAKLYKESLANSDEYPRVPTTGNNNPGVNDNIYRRVYK